MISQQDLQILSQHLPFWKNLTDVQKDKLASSSTQFHYEKGGTLHRSDTECIGIIFIKKGTLRVYMLSDEGKDVTLYRLDQHDVCVLSASCVLNTITFDVHIDAETDSDIIVISSSYFAQLSAENVYVELFSHKMVSERFSDVMWTMQQILFSSFDKRLATFLLDETSKNSTDTINLTHEQIARYTGSAREVVSRMLKYFEKEGYVTLSRGEVKILDRKKLLSLV